MEKLLALVLNILSFITSYLLNGELSAWWQPFKYKRLAWLVGTFLVSLCCVGLVYSGAISDVAIPGPFFWDGANLVILLTATSYYTSQVTYTVIKNNAVSEAHE